MANKPIDSKPQQNLDERRYSALSLRDLLDARENYHVHLMRHPRVVATAVGYYRIRQADSWPGDKKHIHETYARTLTNSEVRPYSWPAILVFVDEWIDADQFTKGGTYSPNDMVPSTLYLPDGRSVPVCVIEAPREPQDLPAPIDVRYPLNNIGSGHPVEVSVQGRDHVATIGCLVSDGHKVFALTNRHVTGPGGDVIESRLGGRLQPIGHAAEKHITRLPFSEVYRGWPGQSTFVNLDVGLIDIDDLNLWTAKLEDGSVTGPMVDLSSVAFPLSLIGRHVRGRGAASGWMKGEIQGLFYRYKSRGGNEYVADFFIGPRTPDANVKEKPINLLTRPGDSGTLWLLESDPAAASVDQHDNPNELRPLALQWGADRLYSGMSDGAHPYALATCLSTACDVLDVDLVRDWNLDNTDTWGAIGHFAIAGHVADALSDRVPKLAKMMADHVNLISHDDDTIKSSDFKGMADDAFVPLADVPDFFWKHGKQGHTRGMEGPNHFADMDHKRSSDGKDLLALTQDPANVDADIWNSFYDQITDKATDQPIPQKYRGLLPFRVWQIFDAMVAYVEAGDIERFFCAAGVLTHYVGDACQPLHISYLHDGDPDQGKARTVHHRDGTTSDVTDALGKGVHSAYEDKMVNANREAILAGIAKVKPVAKSEVVNNGSEAALRAIELMRNTFAALPPIDIVNAYVQDHSGESLWSQFGADTIKVMQDGTHLLAVLWENAWRLGDGEAKRATLKLDEDGVMAICAEADFVPSLSIAEIGAQLRKPATV